LKLRLKARLSGLAGGTKQMAQSLGNKLDSGDAFPDLELQLVGGGAQKISQLAGGLWSVVLLYRGDW
jgi:hypothetical protein